MTFTPPCLDAGFDQLGYGFAANAGEDAPVVRERALWCAVLEQAFVDLGHATTLQSSSHSGARVKSDARRFLLGRPVELQLVCELAGVSAAVIRNAAQLMVQGHLAFYIPPSGRQRSRNRD